VIPFRYLLHKCEGSISRDDNETYTLNKTKFLKDYDRCNPVTFKEATIRHLNDLEELENSNEKLAEYKRQKSQILKGGEFGSLVNYAESQTSNVTRKYKEAFTKSKSIKNLSFAFGKNTSVSAASDLPKPVGMLPPINARKITPFVTEDRSAKGDEEED
jgi:hypothetical protein